MQSFRRWLTFNRMYFGAPPWDTGVSPPELMGFIQSRPPGRALDLGCGTGTNALTLAAHGWDATGVDFAIRAIVMARAKARARGLRARFRVSDVSRLPPFAAAFDLVLDIGCYHGLDDAHKAAYAAQVERLLTPRGTLLMYAHLKTPDSRSGVVQADLDRFGPRVRLSARVDGRDHGRDRPSTWLWFERAGA